MNSATFSHASHFNQKWNQNASCIKHPIKSKANNTDVWTDLDPGGILNGAEQALVGSGMMIFLDKIMLQSSMFQKWNNVARENNAKWNNVAQQNNVMLK